MAGTRSFGVSPACSIRHLIDGVERIGQVDREVLCFVGFDQCQQYLETITVRGARLRIAIEIH